ncbi:MAG TPA: PA2779 family protein [Deltaproteobacteria bacterium]|nr:PA2779 family protein [Deltaproteobacteria bacterium]HPP80375.1 PA2779 family protein [Deltaproteobacteria bacterium]
MRNRTLAALVCLHMVFLATSPAFASLVPSVDSQGNTHRSIEDMKTIEKALEMKIVQEKLRAYGLDAQEVKAKLSSMSPTQIHTLARACDDVLAGGDSGLGVVIALLVIVILVIIILKLLNKEIIIRMSDRDGPAVHTGHPVC